MTTPDKVLAVATHFGDQHYKEGKNNDTIFGQWYGMNHVPWCAMFVSYCFAQAHAVSLVAATTPKGFASCSAGLSWFKHKKQAVNVRFAKAGDVVFFNFAGGTSPTHVGLVIDNDKKAKVLHTIEGNTVNPNGSGDQVNGDGVYYKTRPYRYVVGVGRPKWEPSAPAVSSKPLKAS
jgi:cell wall-associated NlpC family hydrolase